jgi:hypothetical protein
MEASMKSLLGAATGLALLALPALARDFSTGSRDLRSTFSAVKMQQGRVQLDGDVNEHAAVNGLRIRQDRLKSDNLLNGPAAPCGIACRQVRPK